MAKKFKDSTGIIGTPKPVYELKTTKTIVVEHISTSEVSFKLPGQEPIRIKITDIRKLIIWLDENDNRKS